MQSRTQRLAGEEFLLASRRQFLDAAGGMLADALQDIDPVLVGIDLVQSQGHRLQLFARPLRY